MPDERDPHYLHEKSGLEAVVSPPVEDVQVLRWLDQTTELVVASRHGVLARIDPVMGTRVLADDLGEPGALALSPEGTHAAIVTRGVGLEVRDLETGERTISLEQPLLTHLWCGFWADGLALAGEGLDGRVAIVTDKQGHVRARARLPDGAVMGVSPKGRLLLGRVTVRGPEVVIFGHDKLTRREGTSHRLSFSRQGLLFGVAEGGVTVWSGRNRPPITIRCLGVTSATISRDSTRVAMGTRTGGVALAGILAEAPRRTHGGETGGHDQPVIDVDFAEKGRWLASAGARCWLWTW